MRTYNSMRWLVVVAGAVMLLAVVAACAGETVEVPGETVTKEVVKTVEVPGETVVVEKEVVKTVEVPGQTVVVEKEVVKEVEGDRYVRNVWGELVEKPQYGGKIFASSFYSPECPDPKGCDEEDTHWLVLERPGSQDWSVNREEYDFGGTFTPIHYAQGSLVESWEEPDPLTTIFHVRKGVHWHDKPPMNGREFNAYDLEWAWHRQLGIPDKYEFTEPGTYSKIAGLPIESVTATDQWTVEVKASEFSFSTLLDLLLSEIDFIVPREVVEQYGDMMDWRNKVGTGPYELTDLVPGSSYTFTKNPNYWRFDERFPDLELRLPYIDEITILVMPDFSTRLAALRTGKNAVLREFDPIPIDVADSLKRTNPELIVVSKPYGWRITNGWRVDVPPFDDVRVRRAMQKALDLETINRTYYKGYADMTPVGYTGIAGFHKPYAEWPEEVKEMYRYDPVEAERLLDEAGYPRGTDGIRITTSGDLGWGMDPDLYQIFKVMWAEIGVDVTLTVPTGDGMLDRMASHEFGGFTYGEIRASWGFPTASWKRVYIPGGVYQEVQGTNDPTFTALVEKAASATNLEDFRQWTIDADMRFIQLHWHLSTPDVPEFVIHQPWYKGYQGEYFGPKVHLPFARHWIDQELKSEMGH